MRKAKFYFHGKAALWDGCAVCAGMSLRMQSKSNLVIRFIEDYTLKEMESTSIKNIHLYIIYIYMAQAGEGESALSCTEKQCLQGLCTLCAAILLIYNLRLIGGIPCSSWPSQEISHTLSARVGVVSAAQLLHLCHIYDMQPLSIGRKATWHWGHNRPIAATIVHRCYSLSLSLSIVLWKLVIAHSIFVVVSVKITFFILFHSPGHMKQFICHLKQSTLSK